MGSSSELQNKAGQSQVRWAPWGKLPAEISGYLSSRPVHSQSPGTWVQFSTGLDFSACMAAGVSLVSLWGLVGPNISLCAVGLGEVGEKLKWCSHCCPCVRFGGCFWRVFFLVLFGFYVEMHESRVCVNLWKWGGVEGGLGSVGASGRWAALLGRSCLRRRGRPWHKKVGRCLGQRMVVWGLAWQGSDRNGLPQSSALPWGASQHGQVGWFAEQMPSCGLAMKQDELQPAMGGMQEKNFSGRVVLRRLGLKRQVGCISAAVRCQNHLTVRFATLVLASSERWMNRTSVPECEHCSVGLLLWKQSAGNAETSAPLSLSDSVAFPINFRISLKPIVYKTIWEVARVAFWVVPRIGSLSIALYSLTTDVMKTISCLL